MKLCTDESSPALARLGLGVCKEVDPAQNGMILSRIPPNTHRWGSQRIQRRRMRDSTGGRPICPGPFLCPHSCISSTEVSMVVSTRIPLLEFEIRPPPYAACTHVIPVFPLGGQALISLESFRLYVSGFFPPLVRVRVVVSPCRDDEIVL